MFGWLHEVRQPRWLAQLATALLSSSQGPSVEDPFCPSRQEGKKNLESCSTWLTWAPWRLSRVKGLSVYFGEFDSPPGHTCICRLVLMSGYITLEPQNSPKTRTRHLCMSTMFDIVSYSEMQTSYMFVPRRVPGSRSLTSRSSQAQINH